MNRAATTCLLLILTVFSASTLPAQSVKPARQAPARQAHAHNDYLHDRPLLDALDNGFCSVEADIYLIDGELLVAHDRDKTSPDRTLQGLYLDPLRSRIKKNNGSVYGDGQTLTLLIDIKSEGESTYRALDAVLSQYTDILSHVDEQGVQPGAVTAIISGNRAVDLIAADPTRYAGIDGRLSDLDSDLSPDLLPLISDHWGRNFQWRGEGEMPQADREKLERVLQQAHADRRRVRFWATPDKQTVWAALADAGVDLINTDDLVGLAEFLRSR
ncbi:phosphatidylinositol-specific phospholipase C/glycerophosphodiester phosphodiesterase family protein [Planctomycetes bacterium TBK1r]|uniref:Altered inheritance of mitochondria protein 6 n=1 Tax=Stieleria magnilauensis TaxID=2527963 RepID=A0ABX5XWR9_9BACT|nr:hypothetical protein TBK1r_32390 [Planctomycetes bacterium TBK1r]